MSSFTKLRQSKNSISQLFKNQSFKSAVWSQSKLYSFNLRDSRGYTKLSLVSNTLPNPQFPIRTRIVNARKTRKTLTQIIDKIFNLRHYTNLRFSLLVELSHVYTDLTWLC